MKDIWWHGIEILAIFLYKKALQPHQHVFCAASSKDHFNFFSGASNMSFQRRCFFIIEMPVFYFIYSACASHMVKVRKTNSRYFPVRSVYIRSSLSVQRIIYELSLAFWISKRKPHFPLLSTPRNNQPLRRSSQRLFNPGCLLGISFNEQRDHCMHY